MKDSTSPPESRPPLRRRLKWLLIALGVAPLIHKPWRVVYEIIRDLESDQDKA